MAGAPKRLIYPTVGVCSAGLVVFFGLRQNVAGKETLGMAPRSLYVKDASPPQPGFVGDMRFSGSPRER